MKKKMKLEDINVKSFMTAEHKAIIAGRAALEMGDVSSCGDPECHCTDDTLLGTE